MNRVKNPRTSRRLTAWAVSLCLLGVGIGAWAYATEGNLLDPVRGVFSIKAQDPFDGHKWHAIEQTWPGTIVFKAADKSVVLSPLGAPQIKGTYSYEIKRVVGQGLQAAKLIEGTLRMTNTLGQVSESNFKLEDGNKLSLVYTSGQRPEQYSRLTEEEAQNQVERLEQMLRSGDVDGFQLSPALRQSLNN